MFCENCGFEVDTNSAFCRNCGAELKKGEIVGTTNMSNNRTDTNYLQTNPYPNVPMNVPMNVPNNYVVYTQGPANAFGYGGMPGQTIVNLQPMPVKEKTVNNWCAASFITGIIGLFAGAIIFGTISAILGVIGIVTYNEEKHKDKWMGIVGISIGVFDFVVGLFIVSLVNEIFNAIIYYA